MVNRDIGFHLAPKSSVLESAYDGAADVDGDTVDRVPADNQYNSATFYCQTKAGSASDVIVLQMQESADGSTWSDVAGQAVTLSDAADDARLDVQLDQRERYVRLQVASADATVSTTIDVAAVCVLGGAQVEPA